MKICSTPVKVVETSEQLKDFLTVNKTLGDFQ